jgi:hypothetical protein
VLNAERRKEQNHKERGSGVDEGCCTVHARKGEEEEEERGAIEKISAAWGGDSGGIERHRTSCADRTGSHKRSFLVDDGDGTYIGHPTTWVGRREAVEVVGSRKGG